MMLAQDVSMIDKQARDAVCEMLVVCENMGKHKIAGFIPPGYIHTKADSQLRDKTIVQINETRLFLTKGRIAMSHDY